MPQAESWMGSRAADTRTGSHMGSQWMPTEDLAASLLFQAHLTTLVSWVGALHKMLLKKEAKT